VENNVQGRPYRRFHVREARALPPWLSSKLQGKHLSARGQALLEADTSRLTGYQGSPLLNTARRIPFVRREELPSREVASVPSGTSRLKWVGCELATFFKEMISRHTIIGTNLVMSRTINRSATRQKPYEQQNISHNVSATDGRGKERWLAGEGK